MTASQRRTAAKVFCDWKGAADQGYAKAQFDLGSLYEHGQGVAQSYKEAAVRYRKAADLGNAYAQCDLGSLHEHGQSVAEA